MSNFYVLSKRDKLRGQMALSRMSAADRLSIQAAIRGDISLADLTRGTVLRSCAEGAAVACAVAACCGIAPDSLRPALDWAWRCTHTRVIQAADALLGSDGTRRLFRYASFPVPALPPVVRLWRGTMGLPLSKAQRGLSWTTDRDTACYYAAMFWRCRGVNGRPLVLYRDVPSARIIYWMDDGDGFTEVIADGANGGTVDGSDDDWAIAALRYHDAHPDLILGDDGNGAT